MDDWNNYIRFDEWMNGWKKESKIKLTNEWMMIRIIFDSPTGWMDERKNRRLSWRIDGWLKELYSIRRMDEWMKERIED